MYGVLYIPGGDRRISEPSTVNAAPAAKYVQNNDGFHNHEK